MKIFVIRTYEIHRALIQAAKPSVASVFYTRVRVQVLDLSSCSGVTSVSVLAGCARLQKLSLRGSCATDVSALADVQICTD